MSVTAIAFLLFAQAAHAQSIDGRWINPSKSVIIQIAPCGEMRCGTVEWASAEAQADAHKNAPKLIGSSLLTELGPKTADQWRGRLFVPDRNIRAAAKIDVVGPDQIKVAGCALGGLLCDSQVWTRTAAPSP
jgi:uncharacterized protein (DUF2147 family)